MNVSRIKIAHLGAALLIPVVAGAAIGFSSAEGDLSAHRGEAGRLSALPATREQQIPEIRFQRAALQHLRNAFEAYEKMRASLADDTLEGVEEQAEALKQSLSDAVEEQGELPEVISMLFREAGNAVETFSAEPDIEKARILFGEVSRYLIGMVEADSRLAEEWNVFLCPMTEGFQKWFQHSDQMANPYMGTRMLMCGSPTQWETELPNEIPPVPAVAAPAAPAMADPVTGHEGHQHPEGEIAYYTCAMHPSVRQPEAGSCPICGMDLVPVLRSELESGIVIIDAVRQQQIGVRKAAVRTAPMSRTIRTVGHVTYDESRLTDISVKVQGWIEDLEIDRMGDFVQKGEILFTLYSPELYSAQKDYLQTLRIGDGPPPARPQSEAYGFADAARERLLLWDLTETQIEGIGRSGAPLRYTPILSPVSGYVIEKNVVAGSSVTPGQRLYRIASLDRIWVEAEVYESDLTLIREGEAATVEFPYLPGERIEARVGYVYPFLEGSTRTGQVRLELANPELRLRPHMFADVSLSIDLGRRLQVPTSAVIYAGPRRLVFVDLGEGRLFPKEIEVGHSNGSFYEVLSGLEEGEVVVTSGNFLIAAESRLRSAASYWGGGQ